jgi:hypothetical protein
MVVADVNGAEIPVFIPEEVDDVDGLEDVGYDDGVVDAAVLLVLPAGEGEVAVYWLGDCIYSN